MEPVVLLSDDGTPIGTADKARVHSARTPLHLGFSCYAFYAGDRLLVTRRAVSPWSSLQVHALERDNLVRRFLASR